MKCPHCGQKMPEVEVEVPKKNAADLPFRFVKTAGIVTVPVGYVRESCLAEFTTSHGGELAYLNSDFNDKHFAKMAVQLAPGEQLAADLYQVSPYASSEECVQLTKSKEGLLLGAQGIPLLYQLKKELPKGVWYLVFDDKANLPVLFGYHRVPGLDVYAGGAFKVRRRCWDGDWDGDYCVVVLRRLGK